jgi:hypothetical protein
MTKPLEFRVIRGNPTTDELAAIQVALTVAKNSSEELAKQKKKISNWNSPSYKFRRSPLVDSGWQFTLYPGA